MGKMEKNLPDIASDSQPVQVSSSSQFQSHTDKNVSYDSAEFSAMLVAKDNEIEYFKKKLFKTERLLEKANSYNKDLRNELSSLSAEIHNFRKLAHNSVSTQVSEIQIEEAYGNKPMPDWDISNERVAGPSIAETIKATVESELRSLTESTADIKDESRLDDGSYHSNQISDYIYDSASDLYYHPSTGYYWDPIRSLFYDYTTSMYYKYDEHSGQYVVHSVVDSSGLTITADDSHTDALVKTFVGRQKKVKTLRRKTKSRRRKKDANNLSYSVLEDICHDDVIMISDCEEDDRPMDSLNNRTSRPDKDHHVQGDSKDIVAKKNVKPEEDDSSGSLATGESELESGEITDDSSSSEEVIAVDHTGLDSISDSFNAIAGHYPPCIRAIVDSSDHLQLGTLFIITCSGGSIGREKNQGHLILICDSNISKAHAEISYDFDNNCYTLVDKGSQNGTFLNGSRISLSKCVSEKHRLGHGDILDIGSTRLLLHIHKGNDTCEECEPGLVQAKIKAQDPIKNNVVILTKEEKDMQRKSELRNLKKKYGLKNSHYENSGAVISNSDYCDKAYLRRKFVGSENTASRQDNVPASVHNPISAENKGHKLLAKMGWKEGQGLGKASSGIAAPITVEMRVNQSAGLGSSLGATLTLDQVPDSAKAQRWSKVQERFHRLEKSRPEGLGSNSDQQMTAISHHAVYDCSSDAGQPDAGKKSSPITWVHGGTELIGQGEQQSTSSPPADVEHLTPQNS